MKETLGGLLGRMPRPTPAMVVALLALLIAASGAAFAAGGFTATDGTITACRDNKTGVLRVIDAANQTCSSKEIKIWWKDGINGTVANADKLDNKDSTEFAKAYKRTVVVSPVGTGEENGTALLNAISNITDASATKPYLIHIEPATYDLGNGSLNMKPFVDIEGSGELNTVITSAVSGEGCIPEDPATVKGASNAEMRFLTVRNTGTNNTCSGAILNRNGSLRLTHLTAESTGGDRLKFAVWNANNSSLTMTEVTATASGGTDSSYGGINQASSLMTIRQSELSGSTAALLATDTAKVALSKLVGGVESGVPSPKCFNNYDENMAPVTCSR